MDSQDYVIPRAPRKVEATIDGRTLQMDLFSLFDGMDENSLATLADYLSCEDAVIQNVMDQVLTGYTERVSYGASGSDGTDDSPLVKARRAVAERSGEAAAYEIWRLSMMLDASNQSRRESDRKAWSAEREVQDLRQSLKETIALWKARYEELERKHRRQTIETLLEDQDEYAVWYMGVDPERTVAMQGAPPMFNSTDVFPKEEHVSWALHKGFVLARVLVPKKNFGG